MADEGQLYILKQDVEDWNDWRRQAGNISVDLSLADLTRTNLSGANLTGADLTAVRSRVLSRSASATALKMVKTNFDTPLPVVSPPRSPR